MLKALIKKQIAESMIRTFQRGAVNSSGKANRKRRLRENGTMIIMVIAAVYLAAMFTFFSVVLCRELLSVDLGWLYYLFASGAAIIFGTFGSVFSTCFTLYMAKDNDLLLSMPIPIRDVILSRLFSVYLMSMLYSGLVAIPAVIVGWILGGISFPKCVGGLVLVLLLSLIVTGLSCLLGWVVAKLSQRLKNRSFLTVLIALSFLGLYYYIYFQIMSRVENLLALVILLGGNIRNSAYVIYVFGMIGEGHWLGMLFWTAGVLLILGLIWLVLQKTFLSLSTATPTPKRAVYREKVGRRRSVSSALLRREWNRFASSANYMLNCGMPLLLLLGFGGYMLFGGRKLVRTMSIVLGHVRGAVPVMLCAACCMLGGMVDISTPSVSLEGRSLWQLQCLPITPWQALRAKLSLHLNLTILPVLFCSTVLMYLPQGSTTTIQRALIVTISLLNTVFFALFGLFLGLKLPNFSWTNEIVPIKQSLSVFIAIFSGIGLSMAFGGFYVLFGWRIGTTLWMSIFAVFYLVADIALYLWIRGPGSRRFTAL